ncbi:MAG: 4-demethylwyosine synthase TYW1 [Promethearchaeota archaeon]
MTQLDDESRAANLRAMLLKQRYQLYGKSLAVKKCSYTHTTLRAGRTCYKDVYGIESHRCIQCTPVRPDLCTHQCIFCWRTQPRDIGMEPSSIDFSDEELHQLFDTPEEILKGAFWAWKRIISGYKPMVSDEIYQEVLNPQHVALSLAGEPMLYPWLPELFQLIRKKQISSFIVSNATLPERITELLETQSFPTQLYLTLAANNEEMYKEICNPLLTDSWQQIKRSLALLKEFQSRTAIRLTMVDGYNMTDPEKYANLIRIAEPSFVEVKGFVHVGAAQKRLKRENMPRQSKILDFARQLSELLEYPLIADRRDARFALLSSKKHETKIKSI